MVESDVHHVAFLVTDGDNVQWNLIGLVDYFQHPARGMFDMGWALSPSLAELAPSVLHWYYANASTSGGKDCFVAGPSGMGYMYPSRYPTSELELHTSRLNELAGISDLRIIQVLDFDSFNRLDLWHHYTRQPNIDAVIYLDYARYDKPGGILWSNGKPIISARGSLWAGLPGTDVDSVAAMLNNALRDPSQPEGYSLVMVHVWSQTLDDVKAVIDQLDPNVRVVTPSALVKLLKQNTAPRQSFDFEDGLQGWARTTTDKPYDRANWVEGTLELDGSDLGAPDGLPNSWFARRMILPGNARTLRFDTRAVNDGLLRVRMELGDGSSVVLTNWSGLADTEWHTVKLDIRGQAGREVTLYFEQNDGGQGAGEYRYIDNVVVGVEEWRLTVTVEPVGGGSVSGSGKYEEGTVATIGAVAAAGYRFESWMGEGVADPQASTPTVQMDRDRSVTALFVQIEPPTLSIIVTATREIEVYWGSDGVLQGASLITGPWEDLGTAGTPFRATLDTPLRFYRVVVR